jgi:hypothetical protein
VAPSIAGDSLALANASDFFACADNIASVAQLLKEAAGALMKQESQKPARLREIGRAFGGREKLACAAGARR